MSALIAESRSPEKMQELIVCPAMGELDAIDRYEGEAPGERDYDQMLESPVSVYDPQGNIVVRVINLATKGTKLAYDAINSYIYPSKARQVASSGATSYVKKKDGSVSSTTQLPPHLAPLTSVGGYLDRQSRVPYAHATMLCRDHPDKWKQVLPFIRSVDEIFKEYAPEKYIIQKCVAEEVPREWIIGRTAFSTITMNKNFSIRYHRDANDLKEGLGVMSHLSLGTYEGGQLVIPRFRIAIDLKHRDVVLFDVGQVHGVVPLSGSWGRFNRITVVHYLRENLLRCGDAAHEVARGKRARHIGTLYDPEEIELAKVRKERAIARANRMIQEMRR